MTRDHLSSYRWLIVRMVAVLAVLTGMAILSEGIATLIAVPITLLSAGLLVLALTMGVLWRIMALRRRRRHQPDAAIVASQLLAQHLRTRAAMATLWRQQARDHFEIVQRDDDYR